jgi:hypothetical protein
MELETFVAAPVAGSASGPSGCSIATIGAKEKGRYEPAAFPFFCNAPVQKR